MSVRRCPSCGLSRENFHDTSGECYPCHLSGVSFNWVGGGSYGRKAFHERTIGEAQRGELDGARSQGRELAKVPERAELI